MYVFVRETSRVGKAEIRIAEIISAEIVYRSTNFVGI